MRLDHRGIPAAQYVEERLCNSTFQTNFLLRNGSGLQKWHPIPEKGYAIRYTINVPWSELASFILRGKIEWVKERRTIETTGAKHIVKSVLKTGHENLTGRITRVIEEKGTGCTEDMTIEVEWTGTTLKEQIETSFLNALRKLVVFSEEPIISEAQPSTMSIGHFQKYHNYHDYFERLTRSANVYLKCIDDAQLDRDRQLVLPSGDQIAQVTEIVEPKKFSVAEDVRQMRLETERATRLVSEIKRARQQTTNSSVLPIFVLASCTAVVFLAISRAKNE